MSKLGNLLKSEREKKGLSLHEIGMTLKINSKVLKAIEEGDESNFPAKTFLRGFIKSYAQYLRLDINEVLNLFQEEFGTTRPEEPKKAAPSVNNAHATSAPADPPRAQSSVPNSTPTTPKFDSQLRRPDNSALPAESSNRIYKMIGGILLVLLIAFVAKMVDKYQKESKVTTAEINDTLAGDLKKDVDPNVTSGAAIVPSEHLATSVSGASHADPQTGLSSSSTTSTTIFIPTTTLTAKAITAIPTSTTLKVTTTTTTTVKTTTTTIPKTTTTTTTLPKSTTTTSTTLPASAAGKPNEIIVEALNKVTIRYSLNNGKTDTLELNPDQVHTFKSKVIQMEISDGGAVNIIVNGRDRGVPGTIGKSLKLSYP